MTPKLTHPALRFRALPKEEASEVEFRSTTRRTKNRRQEGEKATGTLRVSQIDVARLPKAPRKQKRFGGPRRPRERIPLQIPSRRPLPAHRNFNKSIQLFYQ